MLHSVSTQGVELSPTDKLSFALNGVMIHGDRSEYNASICLKVVESRKDVKNEGRIIDTWLQRPALASIDENRYWRSDTSDSLVDLPSTPKTPQLIRYDTSSPLPPGKRSHALNVSTDTPVLAKRFKYDTAKALRSSGDRSSTLNDIASSFSDNIVPTSEAKFTANPTSAGSATMNHSRTVFSSTPTTFIEACSRGNTAPSLNPKDTPEQAFAESGKSSRDSVSLLKGPLAMIAGLDLYNAQYVALKETTVLDQGTQINIIGVVNSVSEPFLVSHSRNLFCPIQILDPSVCSADDSTLNGSTAFNVNCFTTKYKCWLPRPEVNDIVILRNVKTAKFDNRPSTVGYPDKLQWVVYKPETNEIVHSRGDAPLSESLAPNGMGVRFSHFYNPQPQEIEYCSKLSTWWNAILDKRRAELGTIHQIGGETPGRGIVSSSTRRVHKLIRDVDHIVFQGYFDCVVEVLSKSDSAGNSPYELYVTDYTKNDRVIPMHSQLWPESLAETVLKIKMWDQARPMGRTMEQGGIYRIKNVRMIVGRSGGLEAKMFEPKIFGLLDESDASFDVYLQEFLERKECWKIDNEAAQPNA
ncbi:uncharacterized protein EV420DRAFT_1645303 [Desarmillaria tabescens]|uniref:Protection of telomeres protein 1 n=1 Tax=Armillaria tabescens TaxID=1929756 RepID=A0AA39K3U0_ARMTA|nr:uncharacterized protein EV420DRAFT_1645303 [Desarmillaria tabescens]KAK0454072.1 hypothetical protein EV420DRAFT_1645303 [Desarmillaria tabescens]